MSEHRTKRPMKATGLLVLLGLLTGFLTYSQTETIVPVPYGDMDQWLIRKVKESFIIGGHTREIYEVADSTRTLEENTAYVNARSPWATSSVYAKVHGITKASVSVFPEKRGDGYCARLESKVEHVKVFGIININVLATGALFLGQMVEPITNTDNPMGKMVAGIPFTKKPDYLQFDYKVVTGGPASKIDGLGKGDKTGKDDKAVVYILLQKRWEDSDGNIHALRIGTGWERFGKSVYLWQNKHRTPIHYGNITHAAFFKNYMGLKTGDQRFYTRNSHGEMVPITMEGWGTKEDAVTDIILQFSSSNGGPFIGNPNSKLWIDNVSLVYEHDTKKK